MLEAEFTAQVLEFARLHRWRTAHFRPARTAQGWRTAVQGDGKGFVDLVLARERIIYAELKIGYGKLSPDQEAWRDWILAAGGEWYCWKPSMWPEIENILSSD